MEALLSRTCSGGRGAARLALLPLLLLTSACASCGVPGADPVAMGEPGRTRVILLHDNDAHFHDNFTAETLDFIRGMQEWGDPVFLLNAGDVVVREPTRWAGGPDPDWYLQRGFQMIDRMNRLGYDVAVVGNHELDVQGDATRRILERADFPFLAANIVHNTDLLPSLAPYHLLQTPGGLRIAVLGLSVVNFDPVPGIRQRGFLEVAREYQGLAAQADALVLLTHIGIRDDLDLAAAFPEADVIIGGHTNTLLPEPVLVNGVLVAQAGGQTHFFDPDRRMFMGVVVLEFEGGELVDRCGWVVRIGPDGVEPSGRFSRAGERWRGRPSCSAGIH